MIKKIITLIISIVLIANPLFAYRDDDRFYDNSYNDNQSYFKYNSFTSFNSFNDFSSFKPSYDGCFSVKARDDFYNNSMYSGMIDMWRKNDDYYSRVDTYVAKNINTSDYSGFTITNNTKYDSFSALSGMYEQHGYTDVKMNDNSTACF